jgi:hypothetical protein
MGGHSADRHFQFSYFRFCPRLATEPGYKDPELSFFFSDCLFTMERKLLSEFPVPETGLYNQENILTHTCPFCDYHFGKLGIILPVAEYLEPVSAKQLLRISQHFAEPGYYDGDQYTDQQHL